jgi:hypothetical protein
MRQYMTLLGPKVMATSVLAGGLTVVSVPAAELDAARAVLERFGVDV